MAEATPPADIAAMSFEAALEELETIVRRLEEGKGALDDAIAAYERGATVTRGDDSVIMEFELPSSDDVPTRSTTAKTEAHP